MLTITPSRQAVVDWIGTNFEKIFKILLKSARQVFCCIRQRWHDKVTILKARIFLHFAVVVFVLFSHPVRTELAICLCRIMHICCGLAFSDGLHCV